MPSHNNKGRSKKEAKHVRHYEWELSCPAYRSLSVYGRCLLTELKRRYNGSNNGYISMSVREAEQLLGCSRRPVLKAFDELQQKGFITARQKGSFDWKVRHATEWLLTEYPFMGNLPTKEFMSWRPAVQDPPQEKSRVHESHLTGALEAPATSLTGALETPDGCTRDTRGVQIRRSHGCLRDTANSLPGTPLPRAPDQQHERNNNYDDETEEKAN